MAKECSNQNKPQNCCPVERTLDLIGGKYKALILWNLVGKTLRFSDLRPILESMYIWGTAFLHKQGKTPCCSMKELPRIQEH